jgi:hypothetical protein
VFPLCRRRKEDRHTGEKATEKEREIEKCKVRLKIIRRKKMMHRVRFMTAKTGKK